MNYFLDPIRNHYADFKGRARRKHFWLFTLFQAVIGMILYIPLILVIMSGAGFGAGFFIFLLIFILYFLITLVPALAITVRRLHDAGYSGWLYLIGLIPFIGGLILLVLLLLDSEKGDNKWGPNPKGIN